METTKERPAAVTLGAELRQVLQARKSGRNHFRIDLPREEVYALLVGCYQWEVENRGQAMIQSDAILDHIWHVSGALTAQNPKAGLMFMGQPGNGKTTLGRAVRTLFLICSDRGVATVKTNGMRCHTAKELATMSKSRPVEFGKAVDCAALMIDELGEEPREVLDYGNINTPLMDLLEARYVEQRYTVITTNLTATGLKDRYGLRLADRFREMMELVVFGGEESFRK